MNLISNVVMPNGGVSGDRGQNFLNQALVCMDPTEGRWAQLPADMLVIDGLIRMKIIAHVEKGADYHQLHEARSVRNAWLIDNEKIVAGRRILALFYNSLRRSSARHMNLTNFAHLLDLLYNDYHDEPLDDFMEEFNRWVHLIDGPIEPVVEAHLSTQLM